MPKRLTGLNNPLSYLGVEPSTPPNITADTRSPTPQDRRNFNTGDFWMRKDPEELWYLASLANNVALWIQLYPGGSPGGADQFPTDNGTANEVGGVLNVLGGIGSFTHGAGNTVTVDSNVTTSDGTLVVIPALHSNDLKLSNGTDGQILVGGGANAQWVNLDSSDGTIVITEGPNSLNITTTGGTGGIKTTMFTSSGDFTPDPNSVSTVVYGWNPGNGGGSGRRGAVGSASGGGGGASSTFFVFETNSTFFSPANPIPIVIGAGGLGGAAVTTNNTNGNDGTAGGVTLFYMFGTLLPNRFSPSVPLQTFYGRGGGTRLVRANNAPNPVGPDFNGGYAGIVGTGSGGSTTFPMQNWYEENQLDSGFSANGGIGTTYKITDGQGNSLCDAGNRTLSILEVGPQTYLYLQSTPNYFAGIGLVGYPYTYPISTSGVQQFNARYSLQATSGGGGSGAETVPYAGGFGGYIGVAGNVSSTPLTTRAVGGIQGGTINGQNGIDYLTAAAQIGNYAGTGGQGGAGGGGNNAGFGGNGGNGGFPGGGGGGGGGSANPFNSGAGGAGGNGLIIIYEYLS